MYEWKIINSTYVSSLKIPNYIEHKDRVVAFAKSISMFNLQKYWKQDTF